MNNQWPVISGRKAPKYGGRIPNLHDWIIKETYYV